MVVNLKYPYGIWNTLRPLLRPAFCQFEVSLWDLKPFSNMPDVLDALAFEVSLWDLKPTSMPKYSTAFQSIWSIPMGFETGITLENVDSIMIWSIPMGFETLDYLPFLKGNHHLKYPYGIWNKMDELLATVAVFNLKYPYGIWNLLSVVRGVMTFYLKYPYGIWNPDILLENFPRFVFEVSLWDLKRMGMEWKQG